MEKKEDKWYLLNIEDFQPNRIDFESLEFTIGRANPVYDFPNYVSRHHASFKFKDGAWFITDLKSNNGVFVNKRKLIPSEPFKLHPGDNIILSSLQSKLSYKFINETVYKIAEVECVDGNTVFSNSRYEIPSKSDETKNLKHSEIDSSSSTDQKSCMIIENLELEADKIERASISNFSKDIIVISSDSDNENDSSNNQTVSIKQEINADPSKSYQNPVIVKPSKESPKSAFSTNQTLQKQHLEDAALDYEIQDQDRNNSASDITNKAAIFVKSENFVPKNNLTYEKESTILLNTDKDSIHSNNSSDKCNNLESDKDYETKLDGNFKDLTNLLDKHSNVENDKLHKTKIDSDSQTLKNTVTDQALQKQHLEDAAHKSRNYEIQDQDGNDSTSDITNKAAICVKSEKFGPKNNDKTSKILLDNDKDSIHLNNTSDKYNNLETKLNSNSNDITSLPDKHSNVENDKLHRTKIDSDSQTLTKSVTTSLKRKEIFETSRIDGDKTTKVNKKVNMNPRVVLENCMKKIKTENEPLNSRYNVKDMKLVEQRADEPSDLMEQGKKKKSIKSVLKNSKVETTDSVKRRRQSSSKVLNINKSSKNKYDLKQISESLDDSDDNLELPSFQDKLKDVSNCKDKFSSVQNPNDNKEDKVSSPCVDSCEEEVANNDETDFFPVLSQAFWDDEVSANKPHASAICENNEPTNEQWLNSKRSLKKIQIIDALPKLSSKRRQNSLNEFSSAQTSQNNQKRRKSNDCIKIKTNKDPIQKKKKAPSLQQKIQAQFKHRIPIAGSGSDVRKSVSKSEDLVRIMCHVAKPIQKIDLPSTALVKDFKIPKKVNPTSTVKRISKKTSSRSDFLTEEIIAIPKKKASKKSNPMKEISKVLNNDCCVQSAKKTPKFHQRMCDDENLKSNAPQNSESKSKWRINDLVYKILSVSLEKVIGNEGNESYFDDYKSFSPTKLCYETPDEYISIFMPLLALEILADANQKWNSMSHHKAISLKVVNYEMKHDLYYSIECKSVMNENMTTDRFYKHHGYLVKISIPVERKTGELNIKYQDIMAVSEFVRASPVDPNDEIFTSFLNFEVPKDVKYSVVSFRFICKLIVPSIDKMHNAKLQIIDYIRPHLRKFESVIAIDSYKLSNDILKPQVSTFISDLVSNNLSSNRLNSSQYDAVAKIIGMIKDKSLTPKVMLLQGPPGTGKSYTIIQLIEEIIVHNNEQADQKILLATQTNCAIDELVRKLAALKKKLKNKENARLKFVRLGHHDSMHHDSKNFALNTLIKDNLIHRRKDFNMKNKGLPSEKKWNEEREAIKMQEDILKKADVIVTTLNSAHNAILETLCAHKSLPFFSLFIIDEACQCTELEMLLPFQYNVEKLILVGDPKQLPTTVISKKAMDFNFGRSYFQRSYEYFLSLNVKPPITMLNTQYRMNQEICKFPSEAFYENKIITPNSINKARSHFVLKPYMIFDIKNSSEKVINGSLFNAAEAQLIKKLCSSIVSLITQDKSIAIITPYKQQQKDIQLLIAEKNNMNIEVNTVDSFQGREVDVLILSCVRSHNTTGTLGFLKDPRRLNVAITRARESLFICGNLKHLEIDPLWKSLIENAKSRSLVSSLDENFNYKLLVR